MQEIQVWRETIQISKESLEDTFQKRELKGQQYNKNYTDVVSYNNLYDDRDSLFSIMLRNEGRQSRPAKKSG